MIYQGINAHARMIWLHLYGAAAPLFPHLNGLMSRPISGIGTFRHSVCTTSNFRTIYLSRCLPSVCNPWDAHWLVPGQRPTCSATSPAGRDLNIPRHERKIASRMRSFRRRQAAITKRQRQQLRDLRPKHGLAKNFKNRWNFDDIFSTQPGTAVTLDIGFGSGESLLEMALARPAESFIGIEVHKPGVAKALERIEAEALTNVKIVLGDAVTALCDNVQDRSLDECCIFFPEPFPLARDSERRLVRPLLLSLLSHKMRLGGVLSIATDVEEYANHITRVMSPFLIPSFTPEVASPYVRRSNAEPKEELPQEASTETTQQLVGRRSKTMIFPSGGIWVGGETVERPSCRPVTKYEEKARAADRSVHDFRYQLVRPLDDRLSAPR